MYHLEIRGNGSGPAYLFVHALPGDARAWDPLAKLAPSDTRLLLLDLPDCGRADDERSTDLRVLEDAVVASAGRAGEGDLTLVGSSFGAHLVARLLARLHKRVTRAVLLGGWATLPAEELDSCLDTIGGLSCGRLDLADLRELTIEEWLGVEPAEEHARLVNQLMGSLTRERAIRALKRLAASARATVPPWDTPTVVVHAKSDPVLSTECAGDLLSRTKNGELVVLDADSHVPHLTDPAEMAEIVFA